MPPLLPWLETTLVGAVVLVLLVAVLRLSFESLLARLPVRLALVALALAGVLGLALWRVGTPAQALFGVRVTWTLLIALAAVTLTLPIAALLARGATASKTRGPERFTRRALLQASSVSVPVAAAAGSLSGFEQARLPARLVPITVTFPDLPEDLDGFRILHVTDVHLGAGCIHAEDLRSGLERALDSAPDLVVFTGDVADHAGELRRALPMLESYPVPHGMYAALGNHEYFNGEEAIVEAYAASRVVLLVNEHAVLRVGSAKLQIFGVDDPIHHGPSVAYYREGLSRLADAAEPDAFRLLLCHRPEGFDSARQLGFHLTLAGHTHAGQLGLLGKSVFEVLLGRRYQWGLYREGQSVLYTSSGFGHWFPFRLNCPTELPLITLRRG